MLQLFSSDVILEQQLVPRCACHLCGITELNERLPCLHWERGRLFKLRCLFGLVDLERETHMTETRAEKSGEGGGGCGGEK